LEQSGDAGIERASLAWEIAGCPHFQDYDLGQAGVCTDVIKAQGMWRRPPEGWTGRLLEAPILFVTSNPNTDVKRPGTDPVVETPDELATFNDLYFDSHLVSGARTWIQMQKWATTLRGGRDTLPGRDFALTDAVRCASPAQQGVDSAMGRCTSLYLGRILALSRATVIGFCGKARTALRDFIEPERYRVGLAVSQVTGPLEFFGHDRMLIGLRHPADFYHGDLELTDLGADNLAALQAKLA
jgi:hypothetical protein